MPNASISAVVIAKNEELNLPGFLSNVSDVAFEIIIVDSGSTDRTLEIARAAGTHVRIIEHPLEEKGGFALQRNLGIEAATGDWILNMDCDERLSPELAKELLSISPNSHLNGYRYRRLNYFLNRPMHHGGWDSWNRPQIARRTAHRFTGLLHETCEIDGGNLLTGQMNGLMHHLNDHNLQQRFDKSARYTNMEAAALIEKGRLVRFYDLWWKPIREFSKKYLAQQGFRDGVPGFVAAAHSATAIFRAYALAWDIQNPASREILTKTVSKGGGK